jgi:hypothetical protein
MSASCVRLSPPHRSNTQHHATSFQGVVDAIAWTDVDPQLPHAIAAEFVISKIAQLYPGHAPYHGHFGLVVTHTFQPVQIQILLVARGEVVLDAIGIHFRLWTKIGQAAALVTKHKKSRQGVAASMAGNAPRDQTTLAIDAQT